MFFQHDFLNQLLIFFILLRDLEIDKDIVIING